MILGDHEIEEALEKAKKAFPNFSDWEFVNEVNEEYFGFSMWSKYNFYPKEIMPKYFFITLDTYEDQWRGCLTIGQPSYLWSSANMGDAHLLATDNCLSLDEAIAQLKGEIHRFFQVLHQPDRRRGLFPFLFVNLRFQ